MTSSRFDGMSRIIETRGANGIQTIEYDDPNGRVTLTTATGLAETRQYDSRRRLVRVSQSGDGTTRRVHSPS